MESCDRYAGLKLENQLCFPLYVCAKEVVRRYRPLLDDLGITYTQYIALMALWEHRSLTMKELGSMLCLDSGTLTPLLKKLEEAGYVERCRDRDDERVLTVTVTEKGMELRERALSVPGEIASCIPLPMEDAMALARILKKMMADLCGEEQ
jgi:DNA-binding MarR family transcriptional regulator